MNRNQNSINIKLENSNFLPDPSPSILQRLEGFDEQLLSEEEKAIKRINHGLALNARYQQRLVELLDRLNNKIIANNDKLEKINQIIAFKNKRNKAQLKKKQIEFYQYEDTKIPPESFRILERIRGSKRKKNFSNLYRNLIQGSSSDEDNDEDDDYENDQESSDEEEMRNTAKRTNKLGLNAFLEDYRDQDPKSLDWIALARKANSKLMFQDKGTVITGIDLYRKFIEPKVQEKKSTWTEEDDKKLLAAVKLHGTSNWKQIAYYIDGELTHEIG
jgi:Myb-like DNA-binding domain.